MVQLTREQQKLVEDNHNLIYAYMHKYGTDDYGLLAIGLCKAAAAYNPDSNYKFSTLAYKCMSREAMNAFRDSNTCKRKCNEESYALECIAEIVADNHDALAYFETMQDILNACENDQEKEIVLLLEGGHSRKETAKTVGVTYAKINHIIEKIERKYKYGVETKRSTKKIGG